VPYRRTAAARTPSTTGRLAPPPKLPAPPWNHRPATPQPRPTPAIASPWCQGAPQALHPRPRPVQQPELHPTLPPVICSATSIPCRQWFPDLLNPRSISAGASRVDPWSPGARRWRAPPQRPASAIATASPSTLEARKCPRCITHVTLITTDPSPARFDHRSAGFGEVW
jgi:hypothetical protein